MLRKVKNLLKLNNKVEENNSVDLPNFNSLSYQERIVLKKGAKDFSEKFTDVIEALAKE